MTQDEQLAAQAVAHVLELINAGKAPPLPEELAQIEGMQSLHDTLCALREIEWHFSRGELDHQILLRGFMAGTFKSLQAHLRHLTWQVKQVEKGDFSQRVEFLGEFSSAFNNMIVQLDTTLTELKQKKEELIALTQTLQHEVNLRTAAVQALRQSEAQFKYLSEHDPLTGAFNRRSFFSVALGFLKEASLLNMPCCIAIMDVDFFKRFNDEYGHLAGDEALRRVVKLSSDTLRQSDVMGRYGGEEFIFLFGKTDLEHGLLAAERIRNALANTPIELGDGRAVKITVSMGVVCIRPDEPGERDFLFLQSYMQAADSALYEAKRNGRNQVRYAKGPLTTEHAPLSV